MLVVSSSWFVLSISLHAELTARTHLDPVMRMRQACAGCLAIKVGLISAQSRVKSYRRDTLTDTKLLPAKSDDQLSEHDQLGYKSSPLRQETLDQTTALPTLNTGFDRQARTPLVFSETQ